MKQTTKTALIGVLAFVVGALMFGGRVAVGIAPCVTITPTPTLAATLPTAAPDTGTQDNPIPFGQVETEEWTTASGDIEDFNLAITQVIIGDKAVAKVKQANSFNDNPPDGSTYMLAYVQIQYTKGPKTVAGTLSSSQFEALTDSQLVKTRILVPPQPEINFTGFPGAHFKGWIALTVFKDDPNPEIVIGVDETTGGGGVYFATK